MEEDENEERRCRRTEVVDWVSSEILLFRLFSISLLSLSPLNLPLFLTSEVDYNRDPGSHLWLKSRTYAVCVCVCMSSSMQWDSPKVPEWWSNLFSCPLSLAGTSKSYCLLISKGAAGYLQVPDKRSSTPTSLLLISFCWNGALTCAESSLKKLKAPIGLDLKRFCVCTPFVSFWAWRSLVLCLTPDFQF